MAEPTVGEEQAVVALMQRARLYHETAPRLALAAGILSLLAAGGISMSARVLQHPVRSREFALIWIVVFIVVLLLKQLLVRTAETEAIISEGKRIARRAILPNVVIPIMFTGWFLMNGYLGAQEVNLVVAWIAFYGLTLLSVSLFGPSSLAALGWAFLLTSLSVPVAIELIDRYFSVNIPNLLMGATFGLYHLIYAACAWPRGLKPKTV